MRRKKIALVGNVANEEVMMSWQSNELPTDVILVSENRAKLGWLVTNQFKMGASCTYLNLTHQGLVNLTQFFKNA